MCGACGILGGGPDWVDRVDDAALANGQSRPGRMAERQRRISLVNLLLSQTGLRLSDAGGRLTLRGATGREEIVTSLAHVWIAADRIASRRLDILDDDTIAAIARE